jgi:hypothetical protein
LTARTKRNGTSKFSPFKRGRNEYVVLANDDTVAFDVEASYGFEAPYSGEDSYAFGEPAFAPGRAPDAAQAGHEAEPGKDTKRYSGRHAGPGGKATRKRVGRVVPAAAVAAALAAGAAAYVLVGSGQSGSSHLNAAMSSIPGTLTSTVSASAGNANAAAAGLIKVAEANARNAARAAASAAATPSAKATPTRKPAATPSAAATRAAAAPAATAAAATPTATAAATTQAATTLSCNTSYGMLPDNVSAIVSFLLAHGYSDNAAAGIAGNIYQESKGDPESVGTGGGGLIGWTPLPAGFVTGNVTADLQTQLNQILTYNQIWAQYLPALNGATSPATAADIYVTDFERAGIPAASNREGSAMNVASACGI